MEAVADVNKAWGSAETGGLGEFDALVAHWCRLHPAKAKSGVATDGFRQGRIFLRAFARSPVPISSSSATSASAATGVSAPTVPQPAASRFVSGAPSKGAASSKGVSALGAPRRVEAAESCSEGGCALPPELRALKPGSDIFVSFASHSMAPFALNWVANLQKAGVHEYLVGALDEGMLHTCLAQGIPTLTLDGSTIKDRRSANLRFDYGAYKRMAALKVAFYKRILELG